MEQHQITPTKRDIWHRWQPRFLRGNKLALICVVAAGLLLVSGIASVAQGLSAQRQVAETKNQGDIPKPDVQPAAGLFLSFSMPTNVNVPAIGMSSSLITVGKATDGSIDAPKGQDFDKAAWFHESPAPGQYGASVIVGHVDSYANDNGASVFYNLSKLKPGDIINVDRSDKTTAIFKIYATRQFDRKNIPAEQVYGSNSSNAELRLITCAGDFDEKSDEYSSNAVIFASLVGSRPTT